MAKRGRSAKKKAAPAEQVDVRALVTPEARKHGDYSVQPLPITAGEFGAQKHGQMRVVRNRGGTAVERWFARGDLARGQAEAIALYARAWRVRFELNERVSMNWSLVACLRGGAANFDDFIANQRNAKELLDDLDDAVLFAMPLHYFETWKNVVIHDEAAGVVGSRLGYRNDRAEAAAKAIVLLIADMIATHLRLG